jgi:hypothetical protein
MKTLLVALALVGALASPASAATRHRQALVADAAPDQASAEGYRRASGFDQVKAECELVANGLQPSPGFVMGSEQFVAMHNLGAGIGGLIVHARNYEHCMTLLGYVHN